MTPRLVVADGGAAAAAAAIEFYCDAFGTEEIGERFSDPEDRVIHAEIRIEDSVVMITEDTGDACVPARSRSSLGGAVSAVMATYWDDVSAVWERAVAAGAEVIYPLADQFYGERGGRPASDDTISVWRRR